MESGDVYGIPGRFHTRGNVIADLGLSQHDGRCGDAR